MPSPNWVRVNEFQSEWISLSQSFVQNGWLEDRHNSQMADPSSSWVRMPWMKFFLSQDGWLLVCRIQDGWHHQVEWEWMSLNQIGLVWVRSFVQQVSEYKMAVAESSMAEFKMVCHHQVESEWKSEVFLCKMGESKMEEFKMAGIIRSSGEWMTEVFFLFKMADSKMVGVKMAAIIKMSQNEWVKFFMQNGWIQDGRIQDGCHHHVESEWMSEVFFLFKISWLEECRIQDGWHPQVEWEWMSEVFICSKCLNPRW